MKYSHKKNLATELLHGFVRAFNQLFPNMLLPIFILFFGLGLYMTSMNDSREFGINFLSELTGIVVTVYVVEFFFKRLETIKKVPTRIVVWKKLARVFDQFFLLWQSAYNAVDIPISDDYQDVFDDKMFVEMMKRLSLEDAVSKELTFTWVDLIEQISEQTKKDIDQIISLHGASCDAELLANLSELSESDFMGSLIEIKKLANLRRLNNNSFYSASLKPTSEFFELINEIYRWIKLEEQSLDRITPDGKLHTAFTSHYFLEH